MGFTIVDSITIPSGISLANTYVSIGSTPIVVSGIGRSGAFSILGNYGVWVSVDSFKDNLAFLYDRRFSLVTDSIHINGAGFLDNMYEVIKKDFGNVTTVNDVYE